MIYSEITAQDARYQLTAVLSWLVWRVYHLTYLCLRLLGL